jgi:soluble lytic murein transglycosylase-like protein
MNAPLATILLAATTALAPGTPEPRPVATELPPGADYPHRRAFRAVIRAARRVDRYDWLILRHAEGQRLNPKLVKSIIAAESGFAPRALSPQGARGLMQVLPETGEEMGVRRERLWEPEANVKAGAGYLHRLYREAWREYGLRGRYRDGPRWAQRAVVAAYHGGPAMLTRRNWPPKTRRYVEEVMQYYGSPVTRLRTSGLPLEEPGS